MQWLAWVQSFLFPFYVDFFFAVVEEGGGEGN